MQTLQLFFLCRLIRLKPRPAGIVDKADLPAHRGQAKIRIVLPQGQPVFACGWSSSGRDP